MDKLADALETDQKYREALRENLLLQDCINANFERAEKAEAQVEALRREPDEARRLTEGLLAEFELARLENVRLTQERDEAIARHEAAHANWMTAERLGASHMDKLEAAEAENARLREWKEDALVSLAKWHRLGDALQQRYLLRLGDDIPTALLAALDAEGREEEK